MPRRCRTEALKTLRLTVATPSSACERPPRTARLRQDDDNRYRLEAVHRYHLSELREAPSRSCGVHVCAAIIYARTIACVVPRAGHSLPQEDPEAFAGAVMELTKDGR